MLCRRPVIPSSESKLQLLRPSLRPLITSSFHAEAREQIEQAVEKQAAAKLLGVRKLPKKRSWAAVTEALTAHKLSHFASESGWTSPEASANMQPVVNATEHQTCV